MHQRGFTIVEILIVIVIIGVLASLVVFAYTGLQGRARTAKSISDQKELTKAIVSARNATDKTLLEITGNIWTADGCYSQTSGTDLATLSQSDPCWTSYLATLDTISTASGIDVRNLKDSLGRPYYIDENEGEDPLDQCQQDIIATYSYPFEYYGSNSNVQYLPLSLPASAC